MAHYAFLDENGIVIEVIPGRDENEVIDGITDWENYYSIIRGRKCVRTSYNGNIRKNFAGLGYSYDESLDAFIPPKPECHPEAVTLNEESCQWSCADMSHLDIDN